MNISKSRLALRIIFWALTIATMIIILLFSSQNGELSSQTSTGFINILMNIVYPNFSNLEEAARLELIESIHLFIRKCAHFSIYAILGLFSSLACLTHFWNMGKRFLVALSISVLYAVSDEIHQAFVPSRVGAVADVLIDSLGALLGICIALFAIAFFFKSHIKSSPNS